MKITHRKLHIGVAIAFVLYSVIYTAFVVHGNVATVFFIIGLWVLSSFSDKTRWMFYIFLLVQAWSNWHWIGLLGSTLFIVYCIRQSLIYQKIEPSPANILKKIVETFLKQPFFFLYSVLLFMIGNSGGRTYKSESELAEEERSENLRQRQDNYLMADRNHKTSDPEYPTW